MASTCLRSWYALDGGRCTAVKVERGRGAFDFLIAAPSRMFTPDGGSGAMGARDASGVGGQVCCGREVFANDVGEDSCAGPDVDAGHPGQDLAKRAGLHKSFDLAGDLIALPAQLQPLLSEFGQREKQKDLCKPLA